MAIKEVGPEEFEQEVIQSDKPVLVYYSAIWCGPCKAFLPVIEAVVEEVAGKYKVVKVDVDDAHKLVAELKIKTVPTLMVFKEGKPYKIQVGRTTKEAVLKLFE